MSNRLAAEVLRDHHTARADVAPKGIAGTGRHLRVASTCSAGDRISPCLFAGAAPQRGPVRPAPLLVTEATLGQGGVGLQDEVACKDEAESMHHGRLRTGSPPCPLMRIYDRNSECAA